jgi:hypothetical protein
MLILLAIASGCASQAWAQDSNTESQFWPEFDVYLKLNQNNRIFAMSSVTKQGARGAYADGLTGIFFDHYRWTTLRPLRTQHPDASRNHFLLIRAGYLFTKPTLEGVSNTENTIVLQGEGHFPLHHSILLASRGRFDFRFINGEYTGRFRSRLRIEKPFKVGPVALNAYAHAEGFYDFRLHVFRRFDFTAGTEWTINRHLTLEGYLTRVNDSRATPRFVQGTGVVAQFYFP